MVVFLINELQETFLNKGKHSTSPTAILYAEHNSLVCQGQNCLSRSHTFGVKGQWMQFSNFCRKCFILTSYTATCIFLSNNSYGRIIDIQCKYKVHYGGCGSPTHKRP